MTPNETKMSQTKTENKKLKLKQWFK